MVDDPEKQYTKHDPWETDQTRGKQREKSKRSGRDICFKTLIPMKTCELEC